VFNTDPAQAAASVQRLATLDTEIACFGHAEPITHGAAAQLRSVPRPQKVTSPASSPEEHARDLPTDGHEEGTAVATTESERFLGH
jgi:hypothetical protein